MITTAPIKILDAKVCDSEADVEAALTLREEDRKLLTDAYIYGSVHLRVICSSEQGTCPFTLTGIEFTIDGTNYQTLTTFGTAVDCTANGEKAFTPLSGIDKFFDYRITKLRFVMGGSAPDGSNYITVTAELVAQLPG